MDYAHFESLRKLGGTNPVPADDLGPDADAVLRLVERFAIALVETGMARMPARVVAYALVDDAVRHTVGELAAALRVSPAAVSVAVRELVQAGLLDRERQPGDRSDTYIIANDDIWMEIYAKRCGLFERFRKLADEGVALLGFDRPGGRRLAETEAFFTFMQREFPALIERWRQQPRQVRSG
jgi:DNA-binding transcriptional ArsR family regulator